MLFSSDRTEEPSGTFSTTKNPDVIFVGAQDPLSSFGIFATNGIARIGTTQTHNRFPAQS